MYRGRFAPTPSGLLHLGSLLTALASYLQARRAGGRWLLRIDDLDPERCRPGIDSAILRQLEAHGLLWDETPRHQRRHVAEYAAALDRLRAGGSVYACVCSRARLKATSLQGPDGPVYAGHCRSLGLAEDGYALRLRVDGGSIGFVDGWQGTQQRALHTDVGDFVLRRRDGVIGYQLACAVDEHAQGITEVVRGVDLLGSTFQQLEVLRRLGLAPPAYRHLPVLAGSDGLKLSKQNRAHPVTADQAAANLVRCLGWLGQRPSPELVCTPVCEVLAWAIEHWDARLLPAGCEIQVEPSA